MKKTISHKLVKREDLNHHNTMYAGKCSDVVIESSWVSASLATKSVNLMCVCVNKMDFLKPITEGMVVRSESRVVHVGKSSVMTFTEVMDARNNEKLMHGWISYVNVGKQSKKPTPLGVQMDFKSLTKEEKILFEFAKKLKGQVTDSLVLDMKKLKK